MIVNDVISKEMENSAKGSTDIKEVKSQRFETKSAIIDPANLDATNIPEDGQVKGKGLAVEHSEVVSGKQTAPRKKNRYCNKTPNPDLFMIYIYDLKSRKVISEFTDLDNCSVGEGSIYNELNGQINKIYGSNYEADSITPIASIYPNMSWAFQVNHFDWAIISIVISTVRHQDKHRHFLNYLPDDQWLHY